MTDTQKQFKNAFKAMAILVALFAAIAFFTSCTKTEVIEKNIIQEPQQDLIMLEYKIQFTRWHRAWRYHASISSPKDSLFVYTRYAIEPDVVPQLMKWLPLTSHNVEGMDDYKVVISRKPPKDGEVPQ